MDSPKETPPVPNRVTPAPAPSVQADQAKTAQMADQARADQAKVMDAGKDMANHATQAAQDGAQAFKAHVDQAAQMGSQAMRENMDKSLSALNEVNAQSKRNLEALVASMTAATRGIEALSGQAMAYGKRAADGQVEQAKALSTARSMQEVIELQTNFAKSAMEAYMSELNRASETMSAAVKDTFRPLNERATAMAEVVQQSR